MNASVGAQPESMTIAWVTGVQLAVEARNHRVVVDQPLEEGGQDQGITPVELFIASLGSCIGYFAVRFCQRHKIPTAELRVTMGWDYAEQPHRVGSIRTRVELPAALDGAMKDRLQKVLEGCTVHHSITIAPRIFIQIGTAGGP
jgi:putative redox protein